MTDDSKNKRRLLSYISSEIGYSISEDRLPRTIWAAQVAVAASKLKPRSRPHFALFLTANLCFQGKILSPSSRAAWASL